MPIPQTKTTNKNGIIEKLSVPNQNLLNHNFDRKRIMIQAPGFIRGKNKGFYHYSKPLALDMGSI